MNKFCVQGMPKYGTNLHFRFGVISYRILICNRLFICRAEFLCCLRWLCLTKQFCLLRLKTNKRFTNFLTKYVLVFWQYNTYIRFDYFASIWRCKPLTRHVYGNRDYQHSGVIFQLSFHMGIHFEQIISESLEKYVAKTRVSLNTR